MINFFLCICPNDGIVRNIIVSSLFFSNTFGASVASHPNATSFSTVSFPLLVLSHCQTMPWCKKATAKDDINTRKAEKSRVNTIL